LIATPNVDNANRRQEKGRKLNNKLCVICMQKGIVFIFAIYLDGAIPIICQGISVRRSVVLD
jgi:hypothetical protein